MTLIFRESVMGPIPTAFATRTPAMHSETPTDAFRRLEPRVQYTVVKDVTFP